MEKFTLSQLLHRLKLNVKVRGEKLTMIEQIYGDVKPMGHLKTQYKDIAVYGFDTETPNYTIRLLSISDGLTSEVFDVSKETILDVFIEYFRKVKAKTIMVFAHNLQFDFTVLMNQDLEDEENRQLLNQRCSWSYDGIKIDFFNEKPYFGLMKFPGGKTLELRDTFSFFGRVKLSKLAKILGVGTKLTVDNEDFYSENSHMDIHFREYAKEDARLTALIGDKILEFHSMEDVKPCVSGPQLAMSVFRKNYLKQNDFLIPPEYQDLKYWELSYHGGKNGCYRVSPSEHQDIYLYDINSAYPYAMTKIPSFINCSYEKKEGNLKFKPDKVGIYQISGESHCEYNSTFDHDFTPLKTCHKIWITSYELESLIEHECMKDLKIHAAIFVKERSLKNPLADYALNYYHLKQNTSKETALYFYYKVCMLNSLYGKFIERRYDDEKDYSLRGPNYNPAIASLITGYTRAFLHRLEHFGNALHSATDSVFTSKHMETSKELGGISSEGFGKLQMLRTKAYMFWTKEKPKNKEIIQNGNYFLSKYATHGFHGSIQQFMDLWNNKGKPENRKFNGVPLKHNEYVYKKMPTAGEYFLHKKLKLKLFGMNEMKASLNVDWRNLNERLF